MLSNLATRPAVTLSLKCARCATAMTQPLHGPGTYSLASTADKTVRVLYGTELARTCAGCGCVLSIVGICIEVVLSA